MSPAVWVSNLLATTAAAGSAHFTYTHVTSSPNRAERDNTFGSGDVNFTSGTVRVTEVDHGVNFTGGPLGAIRYEPSTTTEKDIGIGTTLYSEPFADQPNANWSKYRRWRDPRNGLGLLSAANAGGALQGLVSGPELVATIRDMGSTVLNGQRVIRYLVSDSLPMTCPSSHTSTIAERQSPTTLWVNAQGRLVQAKIAIHESGHIPASVLAKIPALARFPMSPSTTTATLRISDFGVPVHIAAPPLRPVAEGAVVKGTTSIALKKCGS